MSKKSQITIYLIIGIVLLASIGIFLSIDSGHKISVDKPAATSSPITTYVESCLQKTAGEGMLRIGLQGGYYNVPLYSISTAQSDVPFYYFLGDISQFQTTGGLLKGLDEYVHDNIQDCLDFAQFKEQGYLIETNDPVVTTAFGEDKVIVKIDMPMTVEQAGSVRSYDHFETDVHARLNYISLIASSIVTRAVADPYNIYISELLDFQDSYGMNIDVQTFEDNTFIYVIQDNQSIIEGTPFRLIFGIYINTTNHAPELNVPDSFSAEVGKDFVYIIDAYDRDNDWLEYDVQSELFGIEPLSGKINWTPGAEDIGLHDIVFIVSDGNITTTKKARLEVR